MKRDKRNAAVVVSDPGDRAALLARVVPAALAVLLLMARGLLLHEHSSFRYGYPAAPLLAALHVRWPLDWLLAGAAVASLIIAAARPSRAARTAALACMALLFAGDQGRLFPGLYGFSLFLFALTAVRDPRVAADAVRVALAAVYMWSGVHKLSPHFAHDLRWFVAPVLRAIGVADGPSAWLTVAAWAAAAGETAFGVALLLPRGPSAVRAGALAAALAMHALIALCIGPLRGGWNNSAWAWNAATAVTAAVAFIARQLSAPHSTHAVARVVQWVVPPPAWRALWRSRAAAAVVALFLVAPALHLVDRWDTSLSFNVYTGNINSGAVFCCFPLAHLLTLS